MKLYCKYCAINVISGNSENIPIICEFSPNNAHAFIQCKNIKYPNEISNSLNYNSKLYSSSLSSNDLFDDDNYVDKKNTVLESTAEESELYSNKTSSTKSFKNFVIIVYPKNNIVITKKDIEITMYNDQLIPYRHIDQLMR
jgi:hypothetical protein